MSLFDEPIFYQPKDADIVLYPHFFAPELADRLMLQLSNNIHWQQQYITIYGKRYAEPRLTAWYGDRGKSYTYSGITMQPHEWTDALINIKNQIAAVESTAFNSVLLNYYRDGKDSMGWHRDNEKELGENPVIASCSFGATRMFHLRHKFDKTIPRIALPLAHGSLLLMKGSTQHFWEHQVPKTARPIDSRINLTFRRIVDGIKI